MTIGTAVVTKKLLVAVSHAIERFALGGAADQPTVVIAMFQRLSYFQREVEMYRRIAAASAVTVVGLVEDLPPALPPGIAHVLLREDEPLAREWSVTVLSPTAGAVLVATDRETIAHAAPTLESGREFSGRWSFRREDAYQGILRLRSTLARRLPPETIARLDEVLERVVASPGHPSEERADAALQHLASVADEAGQRWGALQCELEDGPGGSGGEWDSRSGLRNERYLRRWTAGSAAGTVPLGLVLLRLHGTAEIRSRYGLRAEAAAVHHAGDALRRHLAKADRAVSLGDGNFLALLPAAREPELQRFYTSVSDDLARCGQLFPFVPLPASAVTTVTRNRPLPVRSLVDAADVTRPEQVALLH